MGQGHSYDNPITEEGCSWNFRDGLTIGTIWDSSISISGGTWYSGSGYGASHSINHKTVDIRMNVTDIVNQWLSGSISNDGFMVKRSGSIGNLDSNLTKVVQNFLVIYRFSLPTHIQNIHQHWKQFGMTLVGIVVPFHH